MPTCGEHVRSLQAMCRPDVIDLPRRLLIRIWRDEKVNKTSKRLQDGTPKRGRVVITYSTFEPFNNKWESATIRFHRTHQYPGGPWIGLR